VLRQLVIPAGSPITAPQIAIGPTIPAELVTYYAAFSVTLVAAILYRKDATTYTYDAVTAGGSHVTGTVSAGDVAEMWLYTHPSANFSSLIVGFRSPASFAIGFPGVNGSSLDIAANASLSLFGGATATSTGTFLFQSGAQLNLAVGSVFSVDGVSMTRGYSSACYRTDNGIVCTTPGGGAETAVPSAGWDSEPNLSWVNDGLWRVRVTGFTIESTGAGGAVSLLRVRKGTATVVGTQLGLVEVFHPVGFGGFTQAFEWHLLIKNTSGSTVTTKLSLTINGVVGAGTWSLYGDGNRKLSMDIEEIGLASDHADLANLAVSL